MALVGTANFSVAEWEAAATNGRTPAEFRDNAQATLEVLQSIRDALDVPVIITNSWRSAAANANTAGSARNSQHMTGEGVDFDVPSLTKRDVAARLDAAELAGELPDYHQLIYYLTDNHYHLGVGDAKRQKLVLVSPAFYVPYLGPDTLGAAASVARVVAGSVPVHADGDRDAEPAALPWGVLGGVVVALIVGYSLLDK